VVTRWTQALAKVATDKAGLEAINATGCDAEILTPAQTIEKIKVDFAKWGRVVKDANIKAE
jgi:tripartite-type tricarboxylate transporter receptor subunit TctC